MFAYVACLTYSFLQIGNVSVGLAVGVIQFPDLSSEPSDGSGVMKTLAFQHLKLWQGGREGEREAEKWRERGKEE